MNRKNYGILIIVLILLAIFLKVYPFLDTKLEEFLTTSETIKIDRIIDGDTVKSNKTSIRLLGINSPEKGEKYYQEAKIFLESLILNKTVMLEFGKDREDKYRRTLAYIYFKGENINLKLIEEGYANFYFPSGKDVHYEEFKKAWESCIKENKNLCEKSEDICSKCIQLKEFNFKDEVVVLENSCSFGCELTNWEIKDEGRKKFVFPEFVLKNNEEVEIIVKEGEDDEDTLHWIRKDYVWTDSGDTLFLRDKNGLLVLWESY